MYECQTAHLRVGIFVCARWMIVEQSECSAQCGDGFLVRKIRCLKLSTQGNKYIEDSKCGHLNKPAESVRCRGLCPPEWVYSDWSKVRRRGLLWCVGAGVPGSW